MTEPNILSSLSSALSETIARAAPAIVSVHSHRARASGFVWKAGLIVTADEALADEGEIEIQFADGSRRPATVVGRDHTTDIALLRVESDVAPAKLSTAAPALGSLAVIVAADRGAPSA
ncbi:S1 family peptidase, partial [Bradyrhizobium acaciae]|uniref:S1 family peptidase n=1 Tax=Bradyrhizobium acaciae TaxID=2683706 RepID=UPI001E628BF5